MMTRQKEFKKFCRELFQFLEKEYYCSVTIQEDYLGVFITYQNKSTAVRVSYENREGGVFVLFSKLIGGKVSQYPVFLKPETRIYSFYLDDIVSSQSSAEANKQKAHNENESTELFNKLYYYSIMTKKYANNILLGDFKIFLKLEVIVKKRAGII
jgi:hypothetical protein